MQLDPSGLTQNELEQIREYMNDKLIFANKLEMEMLAGASIGSREAVFPTWQQ